MLTDFNDLHQASGPEAVKVCIENATKPEQAEPVAPDEVVPPDRKNQNTDVGHAQRLAAHVRGRCHFVVEWNKYALFDGSCWRVDPAGVRILAETSAITKQLLAEAAATDNKVERQMKREEARSTESLRSATNAIALLKAQPGIAIAAEAFDSHHFLLNFQNGTLDIQADQFRGHDSRDLLTCVLPYDYNPSATCSLWRRVVSEIWPDAETAAFIQRFAGYSCTGSAKEQVLLFLYGHGANGKTLFAKILQLMLGTYACQCTMFLLIETKQRDHTTEQADLRGKRLAVCAETPAGMYWNEVLLKNATGGDRMKARRMYEDNQEWDATHKFLILGNNKPRVRGQDYATWRRMILVHCDQTFPEGRRDPDLLEKLTRELPGIANWAIEGARMWLRDGGLQPPAKVKESTEDYRTENDVVGPFLLECCVVAKDARCIRPVMYAAFTKWAKEQGYEHVLSPQAFAELMRCRGFDDSGTMRVDGRSKPVWRGVGLLDRQTAMTAMTAGGSSGNFSTAQPHEGNFTENGHSTHSTHSTLTPDPDDPDGEEPS